MTPNQKKLKSLTLSYLDRLLAYVEQLKDRGAHTNMDQMLKAQRVKVSQTQDSKVLLTISDGHTLAKYLERVDALEEAMDDEDLSQAEIAAQDRAGEALDAYLEDIGRDIDETRSAVTQETGELVVASFLASDENSFLDAMASHLEAAGAEVSVVTSLFHKQSLSERLAARKKRKRWLRTPSGKASLRRSKIKAKRPHMINRQKSKTSKLAHHVYDY